MGHIVQNSLQVGQGPCRLDADQRRDLMEIAEDRHEVGSTMIISQLSIDAWNDVIGEPTFAEAKWQGWFYHEV